MIRTVLRRLGLDRVAELLVDQMRRAQAEILAEERDRLRRVLDAIEARIVRVGGRRRPGRPRTRIAVGEGRAGARTRR
ncbi:MAG: hypothetical protein HY720_30120 [Planctomycetes bacterium]|nr:hypothetical protein [Planctomycetota bacterium]